jgi:hypothetical protein
MNDKLVTTDALEQKIDAILHDRFAHILEDISFRINQAYTLIERTATDATDKIKVFAEDLNIKDRVYLTGYAVTNNSPVAGSIAWTDLHVVYNGADTTVTNGNTANKYVWWSAATPTVLQSNVNKPTLNPGDVLLFTNEGGTHKVMLSDTNQSLPIVVGNLSVDTGALQNKAVDGNKIDDLTIKAGNIAPTAITAGKIAPSAIDVANIFKPGVIDNTAIGASAVGAGKLAAGAVSSSANFATNVVTNAAIAPAAITAAELSSNAVTSTAIAPGAIASSAQLATNVVTSGALVNNAVSASKLSIMRHLLY